MTDTNETLRTIAHAAVASTRGTICPADMVLAQCVLESGWLKHAPGNNCFGIKVYKGCPDKQLLHTTEWLTDKERDAFLAGMEGRTAELVTPIQTDSKGRHKYACQDWFAAFGTLADCMAKRVALFDAGPYHRFAEMYRENGNLEAMVRGMAGVYATDPHYGDAVMTLIHQGNVQAALKEAREGVAA